VKSFGQMFVRILLHQMEEEKLMTQEELEFRRRCPYDAFGDYSDVLKEIRQKEKENKTDTVSVVNRSK
jgi:hypothetical protein